jgi:hypothetical protein
VFGREVRGKGEVWASKDEGEFCAEDGAELEGADWKSALRKAGVSDEEGEKEFGKEG